MKNKFLSALLATIMVTSYCSAMSISAEGNVLPENIGTDYTAPATLSGNLFADTNTSSADALSSSTTIHASIVLEGETKDTNSNLWKKGDVRVTNWQTGNGADIISNRKVLDPWSVYTDADGDGVFTLDSTQVNYTYPLGGANLFFPNLNTSSDATAAYYPTPEYDKNVVIRVPLVIKSGSGNVVMNVARTRSGGNAHTGTANENRHEFPIEYNDRSQGVSVSASGTTYLSATFGANPDITSDPKYTYMVGMVEGTDAGITVHIDESELYIGYEYVNDITVTADKTAVMAGSGSVMIDADVVNQVGATGALPQDITWYALDSTRSTQVDGISITPGANGEATVTTDAGLASGDYYLVAVSDAYPELRRGIKISVATLATDFVKVPLSERTDNAITDPTGWGNNYGGLTGFAETASQDTYTISAAGAVSNYDDDATRKHAADGISFSKNKFDTSIYQPGATLVFSASVLSHNTNNPKVTWGMYQHNKKSLLPMEYPTRADGMVTSNTAWKTFGATVYVPEDCDVLGNTLFAFGFSKHAAPASSNYAININRSSMYLAKEAPSDIIVTADKTSIISGEDSTITVDADILNQVGSKGNLSQSITWYVMNAERTETIPGCTITDGEDGTATITLPTEIARGQYSIVALSNANSTLVKGISITVANLDDYVPGNPEDGNVITDETTFSMTYHPQFTEYDEYFTISHSENVSLNSRPVQGFAIGNYDSSIFAPGNTVLFRAKIKATKGEPKFNWGLMSTAQTPETAIWPKEYNGRYEGAIITETEGYQEYISTLVVPDNYSTFQANFGMPTTPDGVIETARSMEILKDGMYLGLERMHDIKVSADTYTWIPGKTEKITVDADILNQFGLTTGSLNQKVNWRAFAEGRTESVQGIEIVPDENDESKAEVYIDLFSVEAGKYEIVAISDEDSRFVRGITIEVEASDTYIASTERVESSAGTFKAMAKLMDCSDNGKNTNAVMCLIATDDSGKIINYEFKSIVDTYDSNRQEKTEYCEITLTSETDKVLVFLLDCGETALPTIYNATVRELTRMKEFPID